MDYHLLREFADSWGLLALTLFFVGVIVWAFRPGSAEIHRDTAEIPFRNDEKPARGREGTARSATFKEARK
ncbi:MAG: cbb3-type cytochrome c oxidase subunit 3 [Defluviimonas sp.]|nr:cbb3-type cytochrome c oxidase subunit 3 [Defluviimonas sp.]